MEEKVNYDEAERAEVNPLARLRLRIVRLNESLLVSLDSLKGERVTPANRPWIRIACKLYLAMEECMLAIDDLIEHKVEECEDGHDMSEKPDGENGERECRREREAVETDKPADNLLGRLKQEYRDLEEQIGRLYKFILSNHRRLDARSRGLLECQMLAMMEYKRVLGMRITYMGEERCEDGHDMSEKPDGENKGENNKKKSER